MNRPCPVLGSTYCSAQPVAIEAVHGRPVYVDQADEEAHPERATEDTQTNVLIFLGQCRPLADTSEPLQRFPRRETIVNPLGEFFGHGLVDRLTGADDVLPIGGNETEMARPTIFRKEGKFECKAVQVAREGFV